MKLTLVAGARPNFMKIAPIIRAIEKSNLQGSNIQYRLVHTGQHYDDTLSLSFFQDLNIPEPHINLGAGSGSQSEQTASIMVAFEKELIANHADIVLVVGDVNSTLACSIVAKKLCVDVVHVEAGIRSGDRTMPEEINRLVTDAISDQFFTTTREAGTNLMKAGIPDEKIHFTGNTMIDSLIQSTDRFSPPSLIKLNSIKEGNYIVLTLHRPTNVDNIEKLQEIINAIAIGAKSTPIVFPVHPRTRKNLSAIRLNPELIVTESMRYLEFMYLIKRSKGVITDSGGIQEETTYLGIPCVTLRNTTERPETVTIGTNELIGSSPEKISEFVEKLVNGEWKKGRIPDLWDGKTSDRIIAKLLELYR
jgi:UDP-N-acetylglucosamine 2-epimerase (non-hydrolysing)